MNIRVVLAAILGASLSASGQTAVRATSSATAGVVAKAKDFVATLSESQRAAVQFAFNDSEQRVRWSNLPTGAVPRAGLRLGDLTASQRTAAMALVATTLSKRGYEKVLAIMEGDEVLKNNSQPKGQPRFGRDEYYISFLGAPSVTDPWMLQFGGHHLAVNVNIAGNEGILTPTLTAAQPAVYTVNGKTVRPLGAENDKAFALINALNPGQQKQAILNYQVRDLVLGPGQDGKTIQPEGIKASALNANQQAMLFDLAGEWTGIIHDSAAAARMAEIKATLADTWFAWSGPTTNGSPAYFRIQGPTLLIEYAPQGSTNHIHTIIRDPSNDYGKELTRS